MPETVLLLSIHPQHGEEILAGRKTVELRKVRPRVMGEGDIVLLYFSSPEKALVGAFCIDSIVVDEPENLWNQLGQATCVSENDYREYFADSKRACGIVVDKAWRFHERITLTELRARLPGFVPPQSFKYLRYRQVRSILATKIAIDWRRIP